MKYRKKPVVIEAFKWTGGHDQVEDPEWIVEAIEKNIVHINKTENGCNLSITTLEGVMLANQGDYIIRGVQGEIYPCKPDIFEATYEKEDDVANEIIATTFNGEDEAVCVEVYEEE